MSTCAVCESSLGNGVEICERCTPMVVEWFDEAAKAFSALAEGLAEIASDLPGLVTIEDDGA